MFKEKKQSRVKTGKRPTFWFQTLIETTSGILTIAVIKDVFDSEVYEIKLSRGKEFAEKTFVCGTIKQVQQMHAMLAKEAEFYMNTLEPLGWVDDFDQLYPFKVGDTIVCEGRQLYQLAKTATGENLVALLDLRKRVVNYCTPLTIYRSLYGEIEERRLAIGRHPETGQVWDKRVLKLIPKP